MPTTLTPAQVRNTFKQGLSAAKLDPRVQAFWGADPQYYLPDRKEIELFLLHNINFQPGGLGTGFDCDDFAYAVKGLIGIWNLNRAGLQTSWCVGVIFGRFTWMPGEHAANWYIDKRGIINLFEPQDHGFHTLQECIGDVKLVLL